jgi:hypothetical protein
MTKNAKIALGCGCLFVLVVAGVMVLFGVGAFWAKSKVEEVTGDLEGLAAKTQQIESLERKANQNPYQAPADGVIPETRLVKFLDARKRVFEVYQRFQADIAALRDASEEGSQPSASDAITAAGKVAGIFTEIRLAQVQALVDVGMSEQEYRDIQVAVYKTAWAAESQESSGQLPAEAIRQAAEAAAAQEGAGALSEEDRQRLQESIAGLDKTAQKLEVPQQNVDLFRKYEGEIRKYAMTGLELIGL